MRTLWIYFRHRWLIRKITATFIRSGSGSHSLGVSVNKTGFNPDTFGYIYVELIWVEVCIQFWRFSNLWKQKKK
jgi:hypothetical protein